MSEPQTMFDIPVGEKGDTPFSPKMGPKELGIRIAAPALARYRPEPAATQLTTYLPVALTLRFKLEFMRKFDYLAAHLIACAVNAKTGQSHCATLQEDDYAPEPPDNEPLSPEQKEITITRWLNFDLAHFLPLPQEDATYHVHVALETQQSNIVTIEVKRAGP